MALPILIGIALLGGAGWRLLHRAPGRPAELAQTAQPVAAPQPAAPQSVAPQPAPKTTPAAQALHLTAITVYAVAKRQNLVRPMLTGKKRLPAAMRAPRMASPLLALAIAVVAAAVSAVVATRL